MKILYQTNHYNAQPLSVEVNWLIIYNFYYILIWLLLLKITVSTSILQTERSSSESNPVSVCPIPEKSVQLMVTKHAQHKGEDSNAPSNPINDLKQISTLSNQNKNEVIDPVTLAINCSKSDSEGKLFYFKTL